MERFCPHPFDRILISVSGDVYTCCSAWIQFPIGNVFNHDLSNIWNSPGAQQIRESIFDGSLRYCNSKNCPRLVSGLVEKYFEDPYFETIISQKEIILKRGPRLISLNYDRSCNLACKSCRNKIEIIDNTKKKRLLTFQDTLLQSELMKNVKRLTVSGSGEVFASSVYMDLFKKININEYPGLKIVLRTNGLLLTPHTWQRIKNMHYAIDEVSISIDAAREETYHKLRTGGKFSTLLKNLQFVKTLKVQHGFRLRLNFVVQNANFREIPEFIELARQVEADIVIFSKILIRHSIRGKEYVEYAVHDQRSPHYEEFRQIINSVDLSGSDLPVVDLTNLSNCVD